MNKPVLKWQIFGVIFIFLLGSLFHFLYDWSHIKLIGVISPVNESVWEHLKLVLYPSLIFMAVEYSFLKKSVNNYVIAKTSSILASMTAIIIIYYTYTFILGHNSLIIDILTFLLALMLGHILSYKILTSSSCQNKVYRIFTIILVFMVILFVVFTFYPPHIPIFQDPRNGTFGI